MKYVYLLGALLFSAVAGQIPAAQPGAADTVKITIQTVPPMKADVLWGRKWLGKIGKPARHPLVIQRPRDSGPLDLTIKAEGYLPLHTRAYTFSDYRLTVKMTPVAQKNTLFGYREAVAPPITSDGGASHD